MDFRERITDHEENLRAMIDGVKSSIWTALPCTVTKVNGRYADLQPAIKAQQRMPDGTVKAIDLPLLSNVPLHFPGGGGVSMTFGVKEGDEALVVFSSRPADTWEQSGGQQSQIDARTHDLSDGFAFVGFRSQPTGLNDVSSSSTQIRSDDGEHVIDFNPGSGMTFKAGGVSMAITSGGVAITGGEVTHNGNNIGSDHVHGGVLPGGSNTTGPH
ncbi:MAG: Gp138 family membrane-puncturing spike protein [Neorhizobium sp.]|nr:Gp138 family membrane-puncturing spike protein [Neorhizobium sp.]